MTQKSKLLVILGVTDDRKPRAVQFDIKDEGIVRKAAAAMNMRVGIARSEQAAMLASKLPLGKIYESGVGLVPLVRSELFYKLQELLVFDQTWTEIGVISGRGNSSTPELIEAADKVWSAIKVGSVVLAFDNDDPTMFGWGAAIVGAVSKDGLTLDLRWRDWPETKTFKAKRQTIGLLRPDVCP
jgi:hypothetical protein